MPGRASGLRRDDGYGYGLLSGYLRDLLLYLGFLRWGQYIGEGGESEAVQGAHTLAKRGLGLGPRLGGVWPPCGPPPAHLRPSGVFYNETSLNNFLCRFREYFLCNFSGIKNSRKQELALWHLVNMLVAGNQ